MTTRRGSRSHDRRVPPRARSPALRPACRTDVVMAVDEDPATIESPTGGWGPLTHPSINLAADRSPATVATSPKSALMMASRTFRPATSDSRRQRRRTRSDLHPRQRSHTARRSPMNQDSQPARTVLPIPERGSRRAHDVRRQGPGHVVPADRRRCDRPTGAPNVLIVMIDDCGFGASSAFGGPCSTPNVERLAANGLKFNRFHTTALCSPTRAALLTGRNHHAVGMGGITEIATSAPGYNSIRPQNTRPAGRDAEAERLQHRAVRQVPRGAGLGDEPDGPVRPLADRAAASRSSTASSAPRPTSGTPPCTTGSPRSSRRRRRRRATTSPRTSPTRRSPGCSSRSR